VRFASCLRSEPLNPQFVGCYGEDGYTHDAECVTYTGPDTEFQGQEICFAYVRAMSIPCLSPAAATPPAAAHAGCTWVMHR
jgi:hypothetical protein